MLSMSVIPNPDYYFEEDYYRSEEVSAAEWAGKGAALLQLSGAISSDAYKNIMQGYSPDADFSLCGHPEEEHRSGWDLTFSVPKPVSVMWAAADDTLKQQIHNAHNRAVDSAVSFIESHAAVTRRGYAGQERESVIGLVAAKFHHYTSRALDPQIHTHCLIANVAPRSDGTWGTIVSRDLYFWQKSAGTMYRSELAKQLKDIGFSIEKDGSAFSIGGVPSDICDLYAKRSSDIRDALKKMGGAESSSRLGDIAALSTRKGKTKIDREELNRRWKEEIQEFGFDGVVLRGAHVEFDSLDDNQFLAAFDLLEELTENKSTFRKQDVYQLAAEYSQWLGAGADFSQKLAESALAEDGCIYLCKDSNHNEILTTQNRLNAEWSLVNSAQMLAEMIGFDLDIGVVDKAVASKPFNLSEEQEEAVRNVCGAEGISILQGSAGSGKSVSMECVNNAYREAGYRVIGACIAKSAAKNLEKEAGIPSMTIAKLLQEYENGAQLFTNKSVLIIDEAGQVGVSQLETILGLAKLHKSKVILVGEDKQLDAIQHGGALRFLSDPKNIKTSRISSIIRQRESWAREAVAFFRDGIAEEALKQYEQRGFLNIASGAEDAKSQLISSWDKYRKETSSKDSLIIAQHWKDVFDLNERVRAIYRSEGAVSQDDHQVECWVSDRGVKQKMAVGERIRLTKNDYRLGLTNGDLATVVDIEQSRNGKLNFRIKLDSGREITLNSENYATEYGQLFFTQAYAMTVYSSQGLTVGGDVFVYYKSTMDRANTYVACSRHKDNCHIFANEKELKELADIQRQASRDQLLGALSESMSSERRPKLAIEYVVETGDLQKSVESEQLLDMEIFG